MAVAVLVLLVLSVAAPEAFATQYVVGGTFGWTLGVNYTVWASRQTYTVGDGLLFRFGPAHSVEEVTQSNYNTCNTNNPITFSNNSRLHTITLVSPGPWYFICGNPGHCQRGMQFSVTVSAAAPGGSPSPPPPPTSAAPSGSPSPPPSPPPPASAASNGSLSPPPPPPPPPSPSAATTANFGGKMSLLVELSLLVVAFVGFTA